MMRQMTSALMMCTVVMAMLCFTGCATAPRTEADRAQLVDSAQTAINEFTRRDPGMTELFDNAYGYAVFPNVGRGGAGVGGAYGRGVVYEQGRMIGYCDLSQGDIGFQLGGQAYRQVIFFQNESALNRFKAGQLAFAAQASAVAATAGASADADFSDGVMVFTQTRGGLMYEATIGGQNFDFVPVERFN
jgi:lipid-binding SYLF domain-containing protein